VPFLHFDVEIRTVICTTNAIESINARPRPRTMDHALESSPQRLRHPFRRTPLAKINKADQTQLHP
jgi:hypothetical protein